MRQQRLDCTQTLRYLEIRWVRSRASSTFSLSAVEMPYVDACKSNHATLALSILDQHHWILWAVCTHSAPGLYSMLVYANLPRYLHPVRDCGLHIHLICLLKLIRLFSLQCLQVAVTCKLVQAGMKRSLEMNASIQCLQLQTRASSYIDAAPCTRVHLETIFQLSPSLQSTKTAYMPHASACGLAWIFTTGRNCFFSQDPLSRLPAANCKIANMCGLESHQDKSSHATAFLWCGPLHALCCHIAYTPDACTHEQGETWLLRISLLHQKHMYHRVPHSLNITPSSNAVDAVSHAKGCLEKTLTPSKGHLDT